MTDAALILDFGSQVTQLIARRLRERGVYCEIRPFFDAEAAIATLKPKALILSGGPDSVIAEDSPAAPDAAGSPSKVSPPPRSRASSGLADASAGRPPASSVAAARSASLARASKCSMR